MRFPEQYRKADLGQWSSRPGDPFGWFEIPAHKAPGRRSLHAMAVDGQETGWEHVSVSLAGSAKQPTWPEMCFVKDLFWDETDWVVQFHPAKAEYVNNHPGVLHLWRSVRLFPTPPKICV